MEELVKSQMFRNENGFWQCNSCNFQSKKNNHVMMHIESTHIEASYTCNFCGKNVTSKNALSKHVNKYHK